MSGLTVTVQQGTKGKETVLQLNPGATVGDVRAQFAKAAKVSVHQVSLKQGDVRLSDDSKKFTEAASAPYVVQFKNLGAQIGYRTVFVIEYFGPMLFVGAFAACRLGLLGPALQSLVFSDKAVKAPVDPVASLAVACWMGHFLKREFETFFVHKFSRPTMPLFNLFKNCGYYWSFGAVIGYPLCSTGFVAPPTNFVNAGLAIFLLSELGNFYCHVHLSLMRPAEGSKKREIPKGFMFDLVACPNYFFEVMSWVGFSIMTFLPASAIFTIVGLAQMTQWALDKHKGYKKSFGDEYKKLRRRAIIPFVL